MDNITPSKDDRRSRFAADDLVGQTIGNRYAVHKLKARGGTSFVYEAQGLQEEKTVALKVILAPRTARLQEDEERIRRFKREANGLAQMKHPNIVTVFDAGVDESTLPNYDIYYIAMQLMKGKTLKERLKELEDEGKFMPWSDVLNIVQQVTEALTYAHEHQFQFVHRDITPSNIMLVGSHVYVFDFGLLKALSYATGDIESEETPTFIDEGEPTITRLTLGTPAYWSPEQIEQKKVDRRTDIYALGGVLCHMLTGQLPYPGKNRFAISTKHLNDPPPRPSSVYPALFAFDEVVTRAMAKEPEDRYQSVRELAQALKAVLKLTSDRSKGEERAAARDVVKWILRVLGVLLAIFVVTALTVSVGVRYFNWFRPSTSLPTGWQSSTEGVSMVAKDDDDYLIIVTEIDASYAIFREGEAFENLNVSVEAELASGPQETAYGLVFQCLDGSNYYAFAVTGSGQVGIWQCEAVDCMVPPRAEHAQANQGWVTQKHILTDRPNRLEITIEDDKARGWVNNQPAFGDEIGLDMTQVGSVGFFVSTSKEAEDPQAEISFTNFTVRVTP